MLMKQINALRRRRRVSPFAGEIDLGVVSLDELPLLKELVQEANTHAGAIIEIGTLFGFTTQNLAVWKSPDKRIITVDNYSWNPWWLTREEHEQLTTRILHFLIATKQVVCVTMDKNQFYEAHHDAPAMVFLDAIHSYEETRKDIEWARRIGARIIAGHDYQSQHEGVVQAVDEAGGPDRLCGSLWALSCVN